MDLTKNTYYRAVGLWVLTIGLGLIFAMSGGAKLAAMTPFPQNYASWGYPGWFLYLVGFLEVLGALLLVMPRYAFVGGGLLGVLMVGAVGTHLISAEYGASFVPLMLLALLAFVANKRRCDSKDWLGWWAPSAAPKACDG